MICIKATISNNLWHEEESSRWDTRNRAKQQLVKWNTLSGES